MTLQQILLALRARWRLALLIFLATLAGTYAASLVVPRQYTAESTVVVDVRSRDPISAKVSGLASSTKTRSRNGNRRLSPKCKTPRSSASFLNSMARLIFCRKDLPNSDRPLQHDMTEKHRFSSDLTALTELLRLQYITQRKYS